tara:strand:+ start:13427 stop:15064 length:1638 start_codon:yes stop_codon:yes gene_type:complete
MDYFLKYPEFDILKNYILKDPICDWFEINKSNTFTKDANTYYKDYICKESNKYRQKIFKKIKELSGLDIPLKPTYEHTKDLINNKSPLILQGVLLDKNNIYVKCDIIITYELFQKIFPYVNNLPFHLYCKSQNDYLLIDISYSTLHFKMDLKEVQNDGILFYKKCMMYSFQTCFYELFNKKYECFLLGKEYYYRKTLLPKKEFIAKVNFEKNISDVISKAIVWVQTLKKNYSSMNIYPEPSEFELFPNMNYNESSWENEKMKLANKIKEITLVWNISYEERCELLNKGIKCWDDPKLLKELKESKKKNIQERMIHMNQQKDVLIYPRKSISNNLNQILESTDVDIYFDVESFLSFDEKQELFSGKDKNEEPVLGILGYIYKEQFYEITIQEFTKLGEKKMIEHFSSQLKKIGQNKTINIYHWGHAENNYFQYIHQTYPKIEFPKYKLINVLDYFRMEPIIIQGVFKFGLKSVGKALYNHGLIETTWEENDNGLDAMIHFKELCKKHSKKIPLKRYIEIKEIIEYNRNDCQVLYEIVNLLRKKYKR